MEQYLFQIKNGVFEILNVLKEIQRHLKVSPNTENRNCDVCGSLRKLEWIHVEGDNFRYICVPCAHDIMEEDSA